MEIKINQADLDAVKNAVSNIKNGYKNVIVTAINKTLNTVKVQTKARIGNEINLKAKRIVQDITVQKANYSKISGAVVVKGEPVGLIQFGATQTQKGVKVKVLRTGKKELIKHAFIANGKNSAKQHVFWRKTRMPGKKFIVGKKSAAAWQKMNDKYRIPLKRLTGPRIEDILAKNKVLDPILIQANTLYLKNIDKKITDLLRRNA